MFLELVSAVPYKIKKLEPVWKLRYVQARVYILVQKFLVRVKLFM